MKKSFVFVVFFIFVSDFLFSLDFSITPFSAISFGTIEEKLYNNSNEYVISLLEWEEKPLVDLGVKFDIKHNNFFAGVNFAYSLPFGCGKMYDSDYDHDLKYIYSINENNTKLNLGGEIFAGYTLFQNDKFSISPVIQINLSYKNLNASNGYGWNGSTSKTGESTNVSWDDPKAVYIQKGKLSDTEITLKNFTLFFGLNMQYYFSKNFFCSLSAFCSPYAYTYFLDDHKDNFAASRGYSLVHQTMTESGDYFSDFLFGFTCSYLIKENQMISAGIKFYSDQNDKTITYAKGRITSLSYTDEFIKKAQASQISYTSFSFNINYSFLF